MTPAEPALAAASTAGAPSAAEDAKVRQTLERTWRNPPGLWGWITSVDHKSIALRYIITALAFFLAAGIQAALMRLQLARPDGHVLSPDRYNQFFTTHGSTMMFLFAVPVMEAMGLFLVPLMIGTRNVAFPRLNAYGYWTYLIGGLFIYVYLFANNGPDAGWFAYVPLSGPEFSPSKRVDVWAQMITFTEIAAIVGAVELIVTAFKQRAPGMSLDRVPLFVWAMVITAFMVLFAMPVVASASMMLAMDRLVHTRFFDVTMGGDAIFWQHLYWFFGHPEVYITFIPGLGIISSIVATFSRRPVFGYTAVVLSMISVAFLSFGLWVHHMFATPLPQLGQTFFTAASAMIAIPTGIQLFCWIATLWSGRPRLEVPLLYVLGFFVIFVLGGMTGLVLASVPADLQVTDTYFVPGHIHYVMLGGMVFPLLGGFHYWFPKATGRLLHEGWARVQFWLLVIGVNVTFFPFFLLALKGMPRRVYTYPAESGWGGLSLVATLGAGLIALSILVFLGNVLWSLRRGRVAAADPWGGETLEWATDSPAPPYNFARLPVVRGRSALWDAGPVHEVTTGLSDHRREVLLTTMLDAVPDVRHTQPSPTVAPLLLALATGVTLVPGIYTAWAFVFGPALAFLALLVWAWPRGAGRAPPEVVEVPR
ncbi:MAG TPA: cytochrome c oxidase subunit I [Gemmatimonadales bacterium]|nr:cytochrome c oxidase subunit I [Gemmatimonadales bacterium]